MQYTNADKNYRSLCNRIGAALLMFYVIFNVLSVGITTSQELIGMVFPSDLIDTVLSLAYYASYLFAFMFPVLFFKLISKKHPFPDMKLDFKWKHELWLIIPAALGINFLMAEINFLVLSPLDFDQVVSMPVPEKYHAYNFILDTIGTAMVPAFCEEFLFRGLILCSLLPYGKKTAIYGSAVLFGLMHQNPGQIIYTVVLGIILGYIAVETGSIWGGIILHFLNNFVSVVMAAFVYVLPENIGTLIYNVIFWGVMAIGLVLSVILIVIHSVRRAKRRRERATLVTVVAEGTYSDGLMGVSTPSLNDEKNKFKLSRGYAARGFFAPLNLVFMILAVVNMVSLIAMAILMKLGAFNGLL